MAVHDPTPPVPGDLPEYHADPRVDATPPVLAPPERGDWVPQAVVPRPAPTPDDVAAPHTVPVGLRLRRRHLVAAGLVVVLALTGIAVIAAGYEPAGRADALRTTGPLTARPTWRPPTLVGRPGATLTPRIPNTSNLPGQPGQPGQPALPGLPGLSRLQSVTPGTGSTSAVPAPVLTPRLVRVPTRAVTPVPTDARSVRFEAWGEPGATIEVTVADSRHTRYLLPARRGPVAFDLALPTPGTPSDFFVVQVRVPANVAGTSRGEVACRVLVGGIVVRSQQGRGSAVCQLSPYYDVRRR